MRNFRSTLVLAVLVFGLFGYLFFIDRHHQGTSEREQADTQIFADAPADKVDSLKIIDPDGTLVLLKKNGSWEITAPISTPADSNMVQGLLNELQYLVARRSIPISQIPDSGKTLQEWELLPGNAVIEFSGPGFSKILRMGRKTAVSDMIYARASREPDAPVILISAATRDTVDKKLPDLRSRAALKVDPAGERAFGLRLAPGPGVSAEYEVERKDGSWKLNKPLNAAADSQRVVHWLAHLGNLRIHQFISDDVSDFAPYGLNAPVAQFWVKGEGDKEPQTLLIGQNVPPPATPGAKAAPPTEVYAQRLNGKGVFTLSIVDVEKLQTDLPAVRDRKVLLFKPAQASGIKAEQNFDPAKPRLFVAVKKGEKWLDPGPPESRVSLDHSQIIAFLEDLSNLEADRIVSDTTSDLKPYGLDHPTATLAVTLAPPAAEKPGIVPAAPTAATLLLGKTVKIQGKPLLYAKNADQPFIYALDPGFLDKWPGQPWTWLEPALSLIPPDQIQSITLFPLAGTSTRLSRVDGVYTTDRAHRIIDVTLASRQWGFMGRLALDRWLGPPQPAYGLAKPELKVEVTPIPSAATSTPPFTLLVGAPVAGGGHAAQIEGQPYAFVISDQDYAILKAAPFMLPIKFTK